MQRQPVLLYLVTEDWYFWSHRLPIARAARDTGWEVLVATRVAAHGERIRREGFRLIPIKMRRRSLAPWREAGTIAELIRIYRRERPDFVHHVAMKPVLYGSLAAAISVLERYVMFTQMVKAATRFFFCRTAAGRVDLIAPTTSSQSCALKAAALQEVADRGGARFLAVDVVIWRCGPCNGG